MKTPFQKIILTLALFVGAHTQLHAQGTAFTYQGRLNFNGPPAAGNFDLRFAVLDANTNGNQLGGALTNSATAVTNGLFTVTLDFGAGIFTGPDRWLEIAARTNGGVTFTLLTPRQAITPTPYAIFAGSASNITGVINSAQLGGGFVGNAFQFTNNRNVFIGDGSGLSGVNANSLNGLQAGNFWQTTGNAGTSPTNGNFLGTTDYQPLELRVNNLRVWRMEPGVFSFFAPNLLGGSSQNFMAGNLKGSVISGGGSLSNPNSINSDWAVIGGGSGNVIQSNSYGSFIGGGSGNRVETNSPYAVIAGGAGSVIHADAFYSTISGGALNLIESNASASVIGGGYQNAIQNDSFYSLIAGGAANTNFPGSKLSTIGGGANNCLGPYAFYSTIAGGLLNTIESWQGNSTIGGGLKNTVQSYSSGGVISGGEQNTIQSNLFYAVIGGGFENTNTGDYSTIPGGTGNQAGDYAFAAGRNAHAVHQGAFVWADSQNATFTSATNNQFAVRATGGVLLNAGNNNVELASGGIKVTGAGIGSGTAVFVHRATGANIEPGALHRTTINNQYCNGNSNAILLVTANYNPGNTGNIIQSHPYGVYYNPSLTKWQIFNEDIAALTTNTAFNVMIVVP